MHTWQICACQDPCNTHTLATTQTPNTPSQTAETTGGEQPANALKTAHTFITPPQTADTAVGE